MLDWLIIGGGIHGTHLSLFLTQRRRIPPERLRVLDPYPEPLALWTHHTINTGMEFLRSSHAHNLHFDPFSLVTFARTRQGAPLAHFINSYGRPAYDLFMAHSAHLIARYKLEQLRLQGRAAGLTRVSDGWRVETDHGAVEARNVVIATGSTEQPYWPEWAGGLREAGAPINHIFDVDFDRAALPPWSHAVVVGGGITAAQTAMTLAARQPGTVALLMRHSRRVHDFDSDPAWVGVNRKLFLAQPDYAQRRAIIKEARHRGSVPPDVDRDLQAAIDNGYLSLHTTEVAAAHFNRDSGSISLSLTSALSRPSELGTGSSERNSVLSSHSALSTQHSALLTDRLILATGFSPARPGGVWLDRAIEDYDLPLAPDGYPIVDSTLQWSDGLYVSGPLAELEIGPVARNFIGARLASECIGSSL